MSCSDKKGNLVRRFEARRFHRSEDGQKSRFPVLISKYWMSWRLPDKARLQRTGTENAAAAAAPAVKQQATIDARDRRLILLFFDFSAMEV